MRFVIILVVIVIVVYLICECKALKEGISQSNKSKCACGPGCQCDATTKRTFNLAMDMRRLWHDHVLWTRQYIISAVNQLESEDFHLQRLLDNQKDIASRFGRKFGDQIGEAVEKLLREHILIAGDIVEAAKEGNTEVVQKLEKEWLRNADDISKALAGLNPSKWPYDKVNKMMGDHLSLTKQQAVAIINKQHTQSVALFDQVMNQIEAMSDNISAGF